MTNHGVYGAVDTRTGRVAWKIPVTTLPDSGVGVAGDLVFFGESNGLLHAADAGTGKVLWTFDASKVPNAGGANASPAFYVVNGKEYVVYGFGGNPGESAVLGDAVIAFHFPIMTISPITNASDFLLGVSGQPRFVLTSGSRPPARRNTLGGLIACKHG